MFQSVTKMSTTKRAFAGLVICTILSGCGSLPSRQSSSTGLLDVLSAARQGGASAQWLIGTYYESGTNSLPDNLNRAAEWYRRGAETNFPHAKHGLALLYVDGRGVPKDLEEANRLLQESAEQGFLTAQRDYALFLYRDFPEEYRDPIRAYAWLGVVKSYDTDLYSDISYITNELRRDLSASDLEEAEKLRAVYPGLYPPWNRR